MQPQKLCLKWNNHTANLLSVLGGFQQRDILVDVTISCEGQNIKAHKMVLSACSPYFQNIFLENPCQHPIVIINGMKYEDITAILNFMYKGEVNVSQDGLTSFLQAAEALKVKGLAEVCGEKRSTNSNSQDVPQNEQQTQNRPQRTDTPPRKRHRNRKRSLSDSNRSDDEGSSRKQHREPSSPEVHELSGDESFTGDTNSNGPPFNSTPRVPQNVYSRSHQSSSNMAEDDDEFEVEPSKLLEQTLTTDNVSMNNSSADKQLRIERIMGSAELESSSLQEPESPPDIKPIIDYGDSSGAGPSEGSMMLYNEQSQPGPSSLQDGSLLHDNAHQENCKHCKYLRETLAKFQKDVYYKLDKIMAGVTNIDERLEVQDIEKKIAQPLPLEEEGFLPIKTQKELQDIESKLQEYSYFVMLVNTLKGIGGSDVCSITIGILKRLLMNEVAELYSWAGAKKKLPFKDLLLFKVILETVRFHRPLVTEAEISELVARWLVHAKLRREREEEKKRRSDKIQT